MLVFQKTLVVCPDISLLLRSAHDNSSQIPGLPFMSRTSIAASCEILRTVLKERDRYFSLGLSNINHGTFDFLHQLLLASLCWRTLSPIISQARQMRSKR